MSELRLLAKKNNMKTFYVTFGQAHAHATPAGTCDKDSVAVIKAEDMMAGREIAFSTFGDKWSSFYESTPDMGYYPRGYININEYG